jgi:hypothetical protein
MRLNSRSLRRLNSRSLRRLTLGAASALALLVAGEASQAQTTPAPAVYYSIDQYTGDGSTANFPITFPYLQPGDVTITVAGLPATFSFTSAQIANITPTPGAGQAIVISRHSLISQVANTFSGGALSSQALNYNATQSIYLIQETQDALTSISAGSGGGGGTVITFPSNSVFASSVVGNGTIVGNDTTGLGTQAAPYLTLQKAMQAVPLGGTIVLNGTFTPATSTNFLFTRAMTVQAITQGAATLTPASGQSAIVEAQLVNGGILTLNNLILNAAGSTTAADIQLDATTGTQTVNVNGPTAATTPTLISGTSQPTITSQSNATTNLYVTGGKETGLGYGINLPLYTSGTININGLYSAMTPASITAQMSYDGGQGLAVGIDADGVGAYAGSVNATINGMITNDSLPATSGGVIMFDQTIKNATATRTNNTVNLYAYPGDTAEVEPDNIAPSQINPLVIPSITDRLNVETVGSFGGGKSGPFIGYEGYPETAQVTFSQAGTVASITANLTGALAPIVAGAAVTFANTGGVNSTAPTPETISSGSGPYTVSVSQTIGNTVLYIAGSQYVGQQAGTSLTINEAQSPSNNGDSHAVNAGEQLCGGPNWAGQCETLLSPISINPATGVGTWNVSVNQNLTSGLGYVSASRMETTGLVEGNVSHWNYPVKGHVSEGATAFCGFASNITYHANYGDGGDYEINDKGCSNSKYIANVLIADYAPGDAADIYGSDNVLFDHNTYISPFAYINVGLRIGQANDWWQSGWQYGSGVISSNLFAVPLVKGLCTTTTPIAVGNAITNVPGGNVPAETITALGTGTGCAGTYTVNTNFTFAGHSPVYINGQLYAVTQSANTLTVLSLLGPILLGSRNACSGGACNTNPQTFNTLYSFHNNDWFILGGIPAGGYEWEWETAANSAGVTALNISYLLSTWQTIEATAVGVDPMLTQYTNINLTASNLNIAPPPSSQAFQGAAPQAQGLNDFTGAPFDPKSPSYGAVEGKASLQPSPVMAITYAGSQSAPGSTGTYYYMGAANPTFALTAVDTVGTDLTPPPIAVAGYVASMVFTTSSKPGYTNPGVLTAVLYDNNVATTASCIVQGGSNSCTYNQSGAPVQLAVNDALTVKYCATGDTTGATCTSYTASNGKVGVTIIEITQ